MIPLFKVGMAPFMAHDLSQVFDSGYIGQGPQVARFEEILSHHWQTPVLTVNSGTSALELALHLAGVGPGDEVISTPLTCTATNGAIARSGATIVWSDIDPETGNISPDSLFSLINERTAAIMTVDWGGVPCDYTAIRNWAREIPIIQDAAHTFGYWNSAADYTCWSFQAIKFLTTGDGGAIRVPEDQFRRAKLLRWFGLDRDSSASFRCSQNIRELGFKMHMNDISATIGIGNFLLARDHAKLHAHTADIIQHFIDARCPRLRRKNHAPDGHHWVLFIQTPLRDDFIPFMAEHGIEAGLVHARNDTHDAMRAIAQTRIPLTGLDLYCDHYVAIPCGWWVGETERNQICEALLAWEAKLDDEQI